jgi:hypothetical protein
MICGSRIQESSVIVIALVFILSCFAGLGCGKKEEEQGEKPAKGPDRSYFANWLKHSTPAFELRYPPRDDLRDRIEAIGNKCDEIVVLAAQMLHRKPDGPIYMMIFPGKTDAENMYGRELPFVSHDTIFYDIFSSLGTGIAQLMLNQMAPEGSAFDFVNEGFPTLLDYSGTNYHEIAYQHVQNGTAIPIADLVDNDKYDELPKQQRREEAASFIGFLTYTFGSAPLVALVKEKLSANGIFMISTKRNVEVLEAEWKNALPRFLNPDTASTAGGGTDG